MKTKYLKKMKNFPLLSKIADTCNIHDISNDDSINVFKNLYDTLINDGYKLLAIGKDQGCWGCFGYQVVSVGVQNPIIYLLEVYQFVKGNKCVSIVIEHRYDINGTIINSSYQQFNDKTWIDIKNDILSKRYQTSDGNQFIPTEESNFIKTKKIVDDEIAERNKNLILNDK